MENEQENYGEILLEYRCSEPSCGLYKDGSFYAYNGTYTFTDPEKVLP
ncbi:MAG: hypothetical protein ACLUO4_07040 [Christensenellales bacterium]